MNRVTQGVVHLLAPEEEWPLEYHHRKDILRSYPDKDVEGQFCYEYPAMPLQCSSDHHRLLGSRGVGGGVIERRA